MSSFQKLWENMQAGKQTSPQDDKAMSAIRTGIGIRDDFWDDFLQVINNSEGLSELLDIPITKISGWHEKVKTCLDKVQKADSMPDPKDNGKLLKTGQSDDIDPHTVVMNPLN